MGAAILHDPRFHPPKRPPSAMHRTTAPPMDLFTHLYAFALGACAGVAAILKIWKDTEAHEWRRHRHETEWIMQREYARRRKVIRDLEIGAHVPRRTPDDPWLGSS